MEERTHITDRIKVIVDPQFLELAFTLVLSLDETPCGSILLSLIPFLSYQEPLTERRQDE